MKSQKFPKATFIGGVIAAVADTVLTVWTMSGSMSKTMSPVVATVVAIGAGTILFALQVTLFRNGLLLAYDKSSPQKTISLTAIFATAALIGITSFTFNLERIAGNMMQAISTQSQIDKRISVKGSVEKALNQGFDQKSNIRSVKETSDKWYECELSRSCISSTAAGKGPVSSLLTSFSLTAKNAEQSLIDLEAEIEPLLEKADHIIRIYDEVDNFVGLDFDDKETRRSELSEKLNEIIVELQTLIPVSVFNGLDKELGKSTATYRALNIGEDASKRIKTQFQTYADEFERQATLMRKAQHYYLPPAEQLSRMEVLTASSDVVPYFLISLAIAFGTWILLGIHILSAKQEDDQADSGTPFPPQSQRVIRPEKADNNDDAIARLHSTSNTTKH